MACEDKSLRAKMPFSLRTSPFALCPSMQRCIPNEISLSQKTKNYALADAKLYVGGCCSVLNKLTLLTYQYETKQEEG